MRIPNGENMTLREVAAELGISWQMVWLIERRAIAKIRRALGVAQRPNHAAIALQRSRQ